MLALLAHHFFFIVVGSDVLKCSHAVYVLFIYIKDDPLSSLDNEVAKWIFENSIKRMLLKHERTVILVTQKTYLVHSSDNVSIHPFIINTYIIILNPLCDFYALFTFYSCVYTFIFPHTFSAIFIKYTHTYELSLSLVLSKVISMLFQYIAAISVAIDIMLLFFLYQLPTLMT